LRLSLEIRPNKQINFNRKIDSWSKKIQFYWSTLKRSRRNMKFTMILWKKKITKDYRIKRNFNSVKNNWPKVSVESGSFSEKSQCWNKTFTKAHNRFIPFRMPNKIWLLKTISLKTRFFWLKEKLKLEETNLWKDRFKVNMSRSSNSTNYWKKKGLKF